MNHCYLKIVCSFTTAVDDQARASSKTYTNANSNTNTQNLPKHFSYVLGSAEAFRGVAGVVCGDPSPVLCETIARGFGHVTSLQTFWSLLRTVCCWACDLSAWLCL
jgi:hypothetical protein